ncbi:sigma-70 family RNA polymerase sigma factor [Ulvibacter litoralis]|uniref:RNA polymerase sigma-70 factor, ECF subfamily n=1 Tax=Ulvibacter litoralis TaxID=227084 RepID=A0A1G7JJR7_9FLAO|nr:sigma-70 family RNA polymerase sigma factor [Ulvibacter litoralis]GHC65312.1 RNA polymerase sigma factor SigJ [Ulvibacter litoralis]SDF25170.1 RNA polymerase sigma-70 factor, ECF subfamily [Ulvibacter litoralis]
MKNYHDILFPYAYNILGSSEDAKDTIQDILVKYLIIDKNHIENEIGYLIKSVINKSINLKKRNKKTTTTDVWLPEPLSTENADDNINYNEILSYSMLTLLEKLTAKERAVFILKVAFDYSHKEIAETIGLTIENSRKLLSRAKIKLNNSKTKNNSIPKNETQKLKQYIEAMQNGNLSALEKLLSKDILLAADGGKNIKVVRELTSGITSTSKLLLYVYRAFLTGLEIKNTIINHQPAILFYQNEALKNCQIFEIEKNKIVNIYSIVDPNKLKSLSL